MADEPAFRVVGVSTIADAGFLRVEDLRVEGPDGEVHQRFVVRHPGAVVVVPVENDLQHVLLVRQYRAAIDGDVLEVPAGKRDVDGETPEATAHRELEEEIGHRAGTLVPLAEFYNTPGFCDEYTYVYAAVGLEALAQRNTQTAEEAAMEIVRIALTDVPRMIAAREIVDAKTIIGLTLARADLERGHECPGPSGPGAEAMSDGLDDLVAEFRSWLTVERGLAPNSIAAYRRDLARYLAFLRARGIHDPAAVQERDVVAYAAQLANARDDDGAPALHAGDDRARIVAVRAVHRFASTRTSSTTTRPRSSRSNRVPQGIPKALTEPEVTALLDAVDGRRPARAARPGRARDALRRRRADRELVGLDRADVDLVDGLVRVFGKGRKERVVPIGRVARAPRSTSTSAGAGPTLERPAAPPGHGRATRVPQRARRRLSRQACWRIVRDAGVRAGLGDRLSPHVLRHSCATHMLDHGADIRVVQELLGHASLSTTQVYTKVSPERLRAVYEAARTLGPGAAAGPGGGGFRRGRARIRR